MEFESYLHPDFLKMIEILNHKGFKICVVGGTVRDYFLGLPNKHDYDCEIRTIDLSIDIEKEWDKLSFENDYKVENLPFKIKRVKHRNFECELSMPRTEIFSDDFSHSNFDVLFNQAMSYETAAKRRDLTINSIMYEFNGHWTFIDPFEGKKDLDLKILRPCSFDFYLDPVRFLRAVRFHILLGFEIEPYLKSKFSEKVIDSCSAHYHRVEAQKSKKPVAFCLQLYTLCGRKIENPKAQSFVKHENLEGSLKDHLKGLIFLPEELQLTLQKFFDYSYKVFFLNSPLDFNKLKKMDEDGFKDFFRDKKLDLTIQALKNLNEKQYHYLEKKSYIDLNFTNFHQILSKKIDLNNVPKQDRKWLLLYKQLQEFND